MLPDRFEQLADRAVRYGERVSGASVHEAAKGAHDAVPGACLGLAAAHDRRVAWFPWAHPQAFDGLPLESAVIALHEPGGSDAGERGEPGDLRYDDVERLLCAPQGRCGYTGEVCFLAAKPCGGALSLRHTLIGE